MLLLTALSAAAADYTYSSTNTLQATNTITASTTNTYAGTNKFDATRYRAGELTVGFTGAGTASNNLVLTFVGGPDGTNWDYGQLLAFSIPAQGTNAAFWRTNLDLKTVGYLKAYQVINTNANDLTNVAVNVWTKNVPRN